MKKVFRKVLSVISIFSWLSSCYYLPIEHIGASKNNKEMIFHERMDRRIGVLVSRGNTYKEIKIYYLKEGRWVWLKDKILDPGWLGNAFEFDGYQAYRVQLKVMKLPFYGRYKFVVYPYYYHWFRKIYMNKRTYYLTVRENGQLVAYRGSYVGWLVAIDIYRPYY